MRATQLGGSPAGRATAPRPRLAPRRAAALALSLLLGGCGTAQEAGPRPSAPAARAEAEGAARRVEASVAAEAERTGRLESSLAELRRRLDALGDDAARREADRAAGQREAAEELARLRSTVEALGRRVDAMERPAAPPRPAAAPRAAEHPRSARAPEPAALAGGGGAAEPRDAPVPSDKASYLAFARAQESRGHREAARELYQAYLTRFPGDPTAADAHFRLGELAYAERRYRDAVVEFGKVAQAFPRSERAPDALLRTADSLAAMNQRDDAAAILSEIPRRYPGTPAAGRAAERLAELGGAKAPAADR